MPSLFAAATAMLAVQPGSFFIHDHDRVVFYGDSITEAGAYCRYVESFILTRFPKLNVSFVNSGWSGDRVTGGGGGTVDQRLDRDVIARKPTVVTILLGMNDGNYQPPNDKAFQTYKEGYSHIVDRLKQALPNARLVLIKPSPYDDVNFPPSFPGGYTATLDQFSGYVEELAGQSGAECVDFNAPLKDALAKAKAYDADVAKRLIPDRIHPEPAGHLVMASELLKAWEAPKLVSFVDLDASRGAVVQRMGAYLTNMKFDRGASWTEEEACLPFPLEYKNPRVALAIRSAGAMTDLNKEGIRVRGLQAPEYKLRIDDLDVGVFSRQQLEDGIELSSLDTPMVRQAWQVVLMTQQRASMQYAQWRTVEIGLTDVPGVQRDRALRSLDALEQAVILRQRELATPHPHRFQLIPTS